MNLKQKLIEIRKEVAFLQKDTKAYDYKYVSEDKVLFAIKDKMDELAVLLVPSIENHSHSDFEFINRQKAVVKETIVSGDMIFTWLDADSDETIIVKFALYGQQADASQAFGSGLTYSNRYFLLKFFQVATNENDPDKNVTKKKEKEDKEYAQSLERIKKNLPDKLTLECPDVDNKKKATFAVLNELGFKNWAELNFKDISENVFIGKFKAYVKSYQEENTNG